jgi:nicotinamide riboside kinase
MIRAPAHGRQSKIAFIGTSCTGKTTLCNQLSSTSDWLVVPEAAREYFSQNPVAVTDRFSFKVQSKILDHIFLNEGRAEATGATHIACDRSAIDAAVYVRCAGDVKGAQKLYDRASPHIDTYDLLIVPDPTDIPYRKDDVRIEDASVRAAIHVEFISFLEGHKIPFSLLSGDKPTRFRRLGKLVAGLAVSQRVPERPL